MQERLGLRDGGKDSHEREEGKEHCHTQMMKEKEMERKEVEERQT